MKCIVLVESVNYVVTVALRVLVEMSNVVRVNYVVTNAGVDCYVFSAAVQTDSVVAAAAFDGNIIAAVQNRVSINAAEDAYSVAGVVYVICAALAVNVNVGGNIFNRVIAG